MIPQQPCYIKNISLEEAETIIIEAGSADGSFLIIDCPSFLGNYKLLVSSSRKIYVFDIHRDSDDSFFSVEHLPSVQGLDQLIGKCIHGDFNFLPPLLSPCNTDLLEQLPWTDLRDGLTNNLHRAVVRGCLPEVRELLEEKRYAVEAMNFNNQTAVHLACKHGNREILQFLIDFGASVTKVDAKGNTPLHYACSLSKESSLPQLLLEAGAQPTVPNPKNGRWPLHEAAEANNLSLIKIFHEVYKVPLFPYTLDGFTPIELARVANNTESFAFLSKFVPRQAESRRIEWFHEVLSRESAEQLLSNQELKLGLFLVRFSPAIKSPVLTLYADRFYHYTICEDNNMWYIGSGPHMPSLEHLIDYYKKFRDGLPINLMYPVSRQQVAVNLLNENMENLNDDERIYYSLYENIQNYGIFR